MTDNQFNQLINALTELLEGIEEVKRILSAGKQNEPEPTFDAQFLF